jgi:hypothetical protein
MESSSKLNRYRENVAFFTNFNPASEEEYDVGPLNRFEISDPVRLSGVATISDSDLADLRKAIVAKGGASSLTELAQSSGIDVGIAFNDLVFVEASGRIVPYPQTDCGRLQRTMNSADSVRRVCG